MSEPVHIKTERLELRLPGAQDASHLLKLFNQPDFIRNIRDKDVRTLEQAEQSIVNEIIPHFKQHGYCLYAIDYVKDNQTVFIGMCGLVKREALEHPDVGFALLSDYQGQGFAHEAAEAVLDYGFNHLNLAVISAICNPDNMASIAVLTRSGMGFVRGFKLEQDGQTLKYFEKHNPTNI